MCRILLPQFTIEDSWWPKLLPTREWRSLLSVVAEKHFEGRYRHFLVLNGYDPFVWEDGENTIGFKLGILYLTYDFL